MQMLRTVSDDIGHTAKRGYLPTVTCFQEFRYLLQTSGPTRKRSLLLDSLHTNCPPRPRLNTSEMIRYRLFPGRQGRGAYGRRRNGRETAPDRRRDSTECHVQYAVCSARV